MSDIEVKVPSLGESITEAVIAKWLKKEGDLIDKDEIIVELETDKVTQEVYSPKQGTISKIFFQEGEEVKIGEVIVNIHEDKNIKKSHAGIKQMPEETDVKQRKIIIPALGESITEATISKWIKSRGELVKKSEPIVEIETDKVTQELYADYDGVIKEILFREQEEVKIGEVIAILETKQSSKLENPNTIKEKKINNSNNEVLTNIGLDPKKVRRSGINNKINLNDLKEFLENVSLSPSARKFMNENEIEPGTLNNLTNTGRITKENLNKLVLSEKSNNLFEKYENQKASTEIVKPLSKLRQSIASKLKEAQNTAAMLTTFNEIDMQSIIFLRSKYKDSFLKKYQVKLGFMSFFTKACITVLKEIPEVNAEIRNNNIIYKKKYDIGIAVGTDRGLLVPVLKNADKMKFADIEKSILEYGKRAKDNKITIEDMKDGTFTISNGGVYGSMLSTPILNSPQSGILGLHNIVKRPVVVDEQIVIRPIMYVALTYDHRIIDGKQAVTFLVRLKQIIENPEEMMFEQ